MNNQQYFKDLEDKIKIVYDIAESARKKGLDPKDKVEIPLARSLAEKVVGLISTIYPQIYDAKIVKRISELEKEHGKLDWRVALAISLEVVQGKFCKFENKIRAM